VISHREAARLQSFPDWYVFEGTKIQIARQIAQGIAGRVVDDQRQNLTDAGIRVISGRVAALENRLNAQQMAPGSALARRVFE
jgi:RNase P/RNase MRP subunit p29